MFRGLGLQSAGGCSRALVLAYTQTPAKTATKVVLFTTLLLSQRGPPQLLTVAACSFCGRRVAPVRQARPRPPIHVGALCPRFPVGRQLSADGGRPPRQVVVLDGIGGHIVELPSIRVPRHELPPARPNRPIPFVLPEDRLCSGNAASGERRAQTDTFHR